MKIHKCQIVITDENLYSKLYYIDLTSLVCIDRGNKIFSGVVSLETSEGEKFDISEPHYSDDFVENFGFKILPPKESKQNQLRRMVQENLDEYYHKNAEDLQRLSKIIQITIWTCIGILTIIILIHYLR